MARRAREISYSGNYHVVLRGNDKLLFVEDSDYRKFLELTGRIFARDFATVAAYYLEDEAAHLVIKEGLSGLSKPIKELAGSYATYANEKYNRVGKLFYDRFASEPLETDEEFLDCVRYVHRLALSRQGDIAYKYSSYSNYLRRSGIFSEEVMLLLNNSPLSYRVYMEEEISGNYLSDRPKAALSDAELKRKVRELLENYTSEQLENMSAEQLKPIVSQIRQIDGASIRKIARVTGLSKAFIEKCGR